MSIFDKIFGKKKTDTQPQPIEFSDNIPADAFFVEQFKSKGGKFLYTEDVSEVLVFIQNILEENNWNNVFCIDKDLIEKLKIIEFPISETSPIFFTKCEHLIVEDGSILFSSKQLGEQKLAQYPLDFIVFATTSQLIKNKDKALSSIKYRLTNNLPTNISAIKDYYPNKIDPNFMNYGNNNSKNLYLILFEDL